MAAGRVTTGVSDVYVALYTAADSAVTYSSGQKLARLVSAEITPDDGGDNNFYADNVLAETDTSVAGGEVTITVDGLKDAANKLIFGLPTADDSGWTHYGNSQQVPYVGVGFVIRVQEDQAVKYVPVLMRKVMFNQASTSAATQEDSIDWQTQELTGRYSPDDGANNEWKWLGAEQATAAAAETLIKTALGIQ